MDPAKRRWFPRARKDGMVARARRLAARHIGLPALTTTDSAVIERRHRPG